MAAQDLVGKRAVNSEQLMMYLNSLVIDAMEIHDKVLFAVNYSLLTIHG